jgi:hypothetical protein
LLGSLSEEEITYNFLVPSLGSIGISRGGGHKKVDFLIANATLHWISFSDGNSSAVTVPTQGVLSDVISQRRSGRLLGGMTPRAWYWLMTVARLTLASQRRVNTANGP